MVVEQQRADVVVPHGGQLLRVERRNHEEAVPDLPLRPEVAGQVFVVFVICIAAGEVAVGLAILIALVRNRNALALDQLRLLRW